MASDPVTESIADRVAQSLAAFEAIDTVETGAGHDDSQFTLVQTVISDQLSRFKLWAGNIGAHRTGRSSLDYRLRDSSHLHTQVMRLLDDLSTSLNEVHSILCGETVPWDQDSGEAGDFDEELKDLLMDEDFEFDSELSQLTKEIADTIGNLLRLSMSLRNPAPHDRFMSAEYAKVRYFEPNDKAHVEARFPRASQTLIVRLGQALSQRRQYFRYRESHHEKLARGLFDSGRSEAGAQSTIALSISLEMREPGVVLVYRELDEDERSDTGFSQTSFATTAPDSERLRIPPLPKKSHDGPFECPFCFMLISVSSTHQWKKHVLRDLRPYICLTEDCPAASKEYGRRHDWTSHMLQKHWKSWACPYQCGSDYTTEMNLRQHVTKIHGSVTEMELDAMVARCGRSRPLSPSSPVKCPLCQDILESVQQYQRHVGRHQVDLALFALPKLGDDDEEPDKRNEEQKTISTRSSSYSEASNDSRPPKTLAELSKPIEGTDEDGDEAEETSLSELEFKFALLNKDTTERQDSENKESISEDNWIVDELDNVKLGVGYLDSREEPTPPPPARVSIINNRIYNQSDSDSEEEHKRGSRRRFPSRTPSKYSRERDYGERDAWALQHARQEFERELDQERLIRDREQQAAQRQYELKRTQKELEELKLVAKIDEEEKRRGRTAKEEYELREAKKELDAIREQKERDELERRIKQKMELERLKQEEAALAEKKRREKEAKEVVERYKKKEEGKEKEKEVYRAPINDKPRPTYTRMARRHLSLETLRVCGIDYIIDQDPDYILIKRWVFESEKDLLRTHTRALREQRASKLVISNEESKDKEHRQHGFEGVRKRERRKSPSHSVLAYLAGERPA